MSKKIREGTGIVAKRRVRVNIVQTMHGKSSFGHRPEHIRIILRVTKNVRATMESLEGLTANDGNVRVIHPVRDPWTTAVSRMTTKTYHGLYAGNDTVSAADVYCSILLRNPRISRRLEQIYPGAFYEMIYDDFVKHPDQYAVHVYNFLDARAPDTLVAWLRKNTRGRARTSEHRTKYTSKRKRKLTVEQSESILSRCKEVYKASL